MATFSASVDAWVRKTKQRSTAVWRESAERIVEIVQTPGPSVANPDADAGGHMPVEFGHLRASIQASLTGQVAPFRENPGRTVSYDPSAVSLVIANAQLGDVITVSYGAIYARIMEERYAFVGLAAQRWSKVVADVSAEAKRRAGG